MTIDTFICSESTLIIGGAQTYIFRMMEYMEEKNKNIRKIIFLWDVGYIDKKWKDKIEKYNIEIYFFSPLNSLEVPKSFEGKEVEFKKNENVFSIAMLNENFINSCFLENKFKHANIKSFYYILHSDFLRLKLEHKFIKKVYELLAFEGILSDRLIFMDQYVKGNAEKYFGKKINAPVIRLGMNIPELDREIIENRIKNKDFTILSISRMAFPFKGYNLGLLEDYIKLKKEYENLKLIFIGYGEGVNVLKSKLSNQPEYIKNDVVFIGKVPYEQLNDYFKQANVFIGMGTTVLDAANTALVTITALAYQLENYAGGYFHDDVTNVGYIYNQNHKGIFYDYIKKVYNYDEKEYRTYSEQTYYSYKEEYGIDEIMKKLLSVKARRKKASRLEVELLKLIVDMSDIILI